MFGKNMRKGSYNRKTKETEIKVKLNLDGSGDYKVSTGIGFLDHMIEQLSRHSLIDIELTAKGDLHIDAHHTVEDSAIALGAAMREALGERKGINRYASEHIPMDETLTRVAIDLADRPYVVWNVKFSQARLGDMDTELFREWFIAFGNNVGMNLHVENLYGVNNHHIVESCFKGLARCLRQAVAIDARQSGKVPSTKGKLKG